MGTSVELPCEGRIRIPKNSPAGVVGDLLMAQYAAIVALLLTNYR
jgi:hypothetical protein